MKFVLVVGQFIYLGKERTALSEEQKFAHSSITNIVIWRSTGRWLRNNADITNWPLYQMGVGQPTRHRIQAY